MQLSLPPQNNNKVKLQQIQQKKKRLKDRIQKMQHMQQIPAEQAVNSYQQNMTRLLQRKKRLQDQKQKQYHIKKMQQQYIERRKQLERQKRIEHLQNQKRMIQLQVGIKRMVFQGTKEKVKGMNSEQLMMRAMLRDGHQHPKNKTYASKGNVRRDFEAFLQAQHRNQFKQKWDIYELNEKRFEVFQKKQQVLMRQILLKQLISKGKDQQMNVLKMNKKQLQNTLQAFGIDINDYMQSTPKQVIISALPQIQRQAKQRIEKYQNEGRASKLQRQSIDKQKSKLKQFLLLRPADTVQICKSIVYSIIFDIVIDYEKRLNRFKVSQFQKVKKDMQDKYEQILLQSQDYQYSKVITLKLLQKIHEEYFQQAAEQVAKLHNLAHTKTQQCFQWMFARGTNITKKLNDVANIDLELKFEDDVGDEREPLFKNQIKKQDYLKKFQDYQTNVFDVDKLTTQLINQINLLQVEAKYFKNISIKIHGEKQGPDGTFHILYDRQFYAITNEAVHNAKKIKIKLQKLGISSNLQMIHWQKFHGFWLIHDSQKISLYSPWSLEVLSNEIGQRVSNPCGKIISAQIFPMYTVIGLACSVVLGFEKGQVLKYNINMNRIDNTQTNLSFYHPLVPQIKKEEEPPFPLQKKNTIKMKNQKITQNSEIHQFRQFFDHHTSAIIGINFHKHNSFITVDKNLKCALWYYDYKEGASCYTPAYTFQFVSSYLVYKQSEETRFKNIYPADKNNQSPQKMYEKWMQTQGYLRKQIYNNPKKSIAYFRVSDDKQEKGDVPLWKLAYDQNQQKVLKIHQSYYSAVPGKMEGKSTKIWKQYLMILCQREHTIREDLKTIKVYGWDIQQRKMRSIGIQFDVYKNQLFTQFQILDNMLAGVDMHLMAVVSSGRILIFSLISGQLLRNISDSQYLEQPKYSSYFFTQITAKRSLLGAATKSHTMQISLNDHNTSQQQAQMNGLIQEVARKYINLL